MSSNEGSKKRTAEEAADKFAKAAKHEDPKAVLSCSVDITPKTPADAPKSFTFPPEMCKQFNDLWGKSFPKGKSQEFGGTIVKDKDGNLSLVNIGGGTSGTFTQNRSVPKDQTIVGGFHTHPYDKSEGGYTNVSLSGADMGNMINRGDNFNSVQSGDGLFMCMRTSETPKNVDAKKMDSEQNARIMELTKKGNSFDKASQLAAKETAEKYKLAYYEGKDCTVNRVSP
jgi:type VI secretion system secreted protein VgrG